MTHSSQYSFELQDGAPAAILGSIEDVLLQLLQILPDGRLPVLQVVSLSFQDVQLLSELILPQSA